MELFQGKKNDALCCHQDQDDLAMFELNSSQIFCEGNRLVDTENSANTSNLHVYGDGDSDDSDVVFMGTSLTILSEGVGNDCIRRGKSCAERGPKSCRSSKAVIATDPINIATGSIKRDKPILLEEGGGKLLLVAKTRSKSYYDDIFEGCNSSEPIEIDDDSVENAGDCRSSIGITDNTQSVYPASIHSILVSEIETNSSLINPKFSSGNTKRKNIHSMLEKRGKRKKGNRRKKKTVDGIYMCPLGKNANIDTTDTFTKVHPSTDATSASILRRSSTAHSSSLNCSADSATHLDASKRNVVSYNEKQISGSAKYSNSCQQPPGVSKSADGYKGNVNAKSQYPSINQESHQTFHKENSLTLSSQLVDMTQENKRSGTTQILDSMSSSIGKQLHQYKGKSELEFDKNKWLLRDENNSRIDEDEKHQRLKYKTGNTSGGAPSSTKSVALEVSRSNAILTNRNVVVHSRTESMESGVEHLPKLAFFGKTDLSLPDEKIEEIQRFSCDLKTQAGSIEIIDVDEIENTEVVTESNRRFQHRSNVENEIETKREETTIKAKPRFKPFKTKKCRKNEKEPRAVPSKKNSNICTDISNPTFGPSHLPYLSRPKSNEDPSKSTVTNSSSYNIVAQNDGGKSKISSKSFPSRTYIPSPQNRFIFHYSNGKPNDHHSKNFLGMNIEDALQEQERLLQKAAARVRNQPVFRVQAGHSRPRNMVRSVRFPTIVRNVHLEYSNHWKLLDFYSRLGLPAHANESMVKSQYRRLARVYHPDRNIGKPDTKHKFQAVTEAYNNLMNA